MIGKNILLEKGLLEKAATIIWFEYSLLSCELKKQTSVAKDQYRGLERVSGYVKKKIIDNKIKREEKGDDKTPKIKKYSKSNLIHDCKHSFHKYQSIKKFDKYFFNQNIHF